MPSSSPQISRPSGVRRRTSPAGTGSGSTRPGSSRYERISSTMTVRSLSISALRGRGRTISSPRTSIAAGGLAERDADPVDRRFAVRGRVERAADPLDRLRDRPASSGSAAVPLKVMCSMKWATPAWLGRSRGASRPGRRRRWRPSARRGGERVMTRGPSGSAVRSNIRRDGTRCGGRRPAQGAAGRSVPGAIGSG